MWELKEWVNPYLLSGFFLSHNPLAIDYLMDNPNLIYWDVLSHNEEATHLLIQNPDNINWTTLSLNTNKMAIHLLAKNMSQINWLNFSKNPAGIEILLHYETHLHHYANMYAFNQNPHPKAIDYFLENEKEIIWDAMSDNIGAKRIFDKFGISKVDWLVLSKNPNMIDTLLNNKRFIYWPYFSMNPHPMAIKYLEEHPHLIDWSFISMNPSAEDIIMKNLDRVCWNTLSKNPIIFKFNMYKCDQVKRTQLYKEELLSVALHPDRIKKYLDAGYKLNDVI